jgi:hypothetical protein
MLTPSGPRSLNTARVLALVEVGLLVAAWLWVGDVGVSVLVWFQAGQGDWTQLLSLLLVFAAVIAVLVVAGLKLPRRRWARWVVGTLQAISIPVLMLYGSGAAGGVLGSGAGPGVAASPLHPGPPLAVHLSAHGAVTSCSLHPTLWAGVAAAALLTPLRRGQPGLSGVSSSRMRCASSAVPTWGRHAGRRATPSTWCSNVLGIEPACRWTGHPLSGPLGQKCP